MNCHCQPKSIQIVLAGADWIMDRAVELVDQTAHMVFVLAEKSPAAMVVARIDCRGSCHARSYFGLFVVRKEAEVNQELALVAIQTLVAVEPEGGRL